jgi:outer membrane protein assembly factor BamB
MPRAVRGAALCLVLALAGLPSVRAAQPQFWKIEGAREFLEGSTEGLSVDSEGRVRLAPASKSLFETDTPHAWCLARDAKGVLYAGTGNDGKVFRIEAGKGQLFFDAAELEVHALAIGPDGRVYVGSSPDGKVYAVDSSGKSEIFYDPAERYIWALAFDSRANLLVGTGAEGKVYRVDRQGKAQAILTSGETHITALASDKSGTVFAGSAPNGILYRIDASGKVFVLHDSPFQEVKALDVGRDGSLYAAVIDGKEHEESASPSTPTVVAPTAIPTGEVTVTEGFTVIPPIGPSPSPSPRTIETPKLGSAKGAVLRILPSGEVDTVWSSADETPHALVVDGDSALVGTGNKGKVYRVNNDRTWTMVSAFPSEQVTALQRGAGGGLFLATSNPGRVYALEGRPGEKGTFTSEPKDTETVSAWGRLRWTATTPKATAVQIQTRSGNTSAPDSTWSEWSAPYHHSDGDPVTSERSRFLQVRVALVGKDGASPVLDSVTTPYLQRNLRPQVQSVTVHPPGEVFQKPLSLSGEPEILGLETNPASDSRSSAAALRAGLPPATSYSRKLFQRGIQTFSWKADDPNGDALVYDVYYRPVGDNRFRLLRKGLTDSVLAWDTSTVPNGRYVIRVVASDSPANPESLALTGDKESTPFDVDNTPPTVTATLVSRSPVRIKVVVKDDSSLVRRAEYSIDGGRWMEVHPVDGINDAIEESYEIVPGELSAGGPHVIVTRATDLLGNVGTARVDIP